MTQSRRNQEDVPDTPDRSIPWKFAENKNRSSPPSDRSNGDDGYSNAAITGVLRKITGYNPNKYDDRLLSDAALARSMTANKRDIDAEEAQALKVARLEDKLEAVRGAHRVVDFDSDSDYE